MPWAFRSEKLKVFLRDVEEITRKENQTYGSRDFAETGDDTPVTSGEIREAAEQINKKLAEINGLGDDRRSTHAPAGIRSLTGGLRQRKTNRAFCSLTTSTSVTNARLFSARQKAIWDSEGSICGGKKRLEQNGDY